MVDTFELRYPIDVRHVLGMRHRLPKCMMKSLLNLFPNITFIASISTPLNFIDSFAERIFETSSSLLFITLHKTIYLGDENYFRQYNMVHKIMS